MRTGADLEPGSTISCLWSAFVEPRTSACDVAPAIRCRHASRRLPARLYAALNAFAECGRVHGAPDLDSCATALSTCPISRSERRNDVATGEDSGPIKRARLKPCLQRRPGLAPAQGSGWRHWHGHASTFREKPAIAGIAMEALEALSMPATSWANGPWQG